MTKCECADKGCAVHKGRAECRFGQGDGCPMTRLYRVDMEDRSGTLFCLPCADDAMESGLYTDGIDDTDPDTCEPSEPEAEDYTLTPCGPLGSRVFVAQVGAALNRSLGEFADEDAALAAIKAECELFAFWPNVWRISDHGNAVCITSGAL